MQELLDEDLRAGGAEAVAHEHVVYRGLGLLGRFRDDDALAGRKSVRLDDNWEPERGQRGLGGCGVGERLGPASGHACGVHDFLGESLQAFHAGASRDRPDRKSVV